MSGLKLSASNIGWRVEDDARVFDLMAELGFEGLEIAPTRVIPVSPYSKPEEFSVFAKCVHDEYGLSICSMQSIWRGRNENIFDSDGAAELIKHTKRACLFASAGGVRNLVFGCPRNRNVPDGRDPAEAAPFLKECGRIAAEKGVVFALEANPPIYSTNFLNSTADVHKYLEANLSEAVGLGLNLDVGAMLAMGEGVNVVSMVSTRVSHVHISEPGLAPVEARQLHSELRTILEDVHYGGFISLEMAAADYDTVCRCLKYMAKVFLG